MKRTALITGINGQDGAYLARLLLGKGYEVVGGVRAGSQGSLWRLAELGIADQVRIVPLELLEMTNLLQALEKSQPDQVYHLAAQSFVGFSFEQPVYTAEVTALGTLRLLEAIRAVNPAIRFYQASSSEMFGNMKETPQNEATPFRPSSPYAFAKLFAHFATVNYREAHGLFAVSGICFNHESPLRGEEFVTRKIAVAAARIKAGLQKELVLGNLEAQRDWGYAPEYVEAMFLMLQQGEPDDYVVATGEAHSVREFAEAAFAELGLDWRDFVRHDPALMRPRDVQRLVGDATEAREKLGWVASVRFRELVRIMVEAELRKIAIPSEGPALPIAPTRADRPSIGRASD